MSEQNFNGGGVATQEPPAETPDAPDTGSRRNLVIVGIAVAVALLVAVWFLFLSGGGSSTPTGAVPQASLKANGAGPGKTTVKKKKTTVVIPPAASKDTDGRDPFKALLKPEASASASPVATTAPSASASTPPSTPAPVGQHPGLRDRRRHGQPGLHRQQGQDGELHRRDHQ